MTAAVTPVSYPFEPVIVASKQLLYGVRPDRLLFVSKNGETVRFGGLLFERRYDIKDQRVIE